LPDGYRANVGHVLCPTYENYENSRYGQSPRSAMTRSRNSARCW
jgi:hypothetical protein